eukprot:scaffold1535_cov382-Prasinococcus_capsulatus_cf.AAC.65
MAADKGSHTQLEVKPFGDPSIVHALLVPFYNVLLHVDEERIILRVTDSIFTKLCSEEELPSLVSTQLIGEVCRTLFDLGASQSAREVLYDVSSKLRVTYKKRRKKEGVDGDVRSYAQLVEDVTAGVLDANGDAEALETKPKLDKREKKQKVVP